MEPANISVTRTLAIDGALLGDVLLRLRRDAGPGPLRWTLGDRGVAEVDVKLTLQPTTALTPFWQDRGEELLELAHAAIDELSEELLWHASKTGVTAES